MIDITHIEPNQKLLKYVRRICIFESKREIQYKQKLTPSAYTILSYSHKDIPVPKIGKEEYSDLERLQIAGPKISNDISIEYSGNLSQVLIEFTATGFYDLFHTSPNILVNRICNLSQFSVKNSEGLESELKITDGYHKHVKIIENWLLEKKNKVLPLNNYIEKAVSILEKSNGHINIAKLLDQIYKSERQFERQFKNIVGISPKHFSKIVQLHHVINLMQKKEYGSIQDLSYQANYYDASSFSNKFKSLTGFTPSEFLESDDHIALKYFTDLP